MDKHILVVDDESGITLLCKRLLSRAGYEVTAFTQAVMALDFIKDNPVDLLLVDIRMPDVDGFEVIRQVKQVQPDIAVLVMTGFGTVETAIQALRQGVDGLLLKPFEKGDELVEAVKQAFADSEKKRNAAQIQALRPLFSVTESLVAETRPEQLGKMVKEALESHLHCPHVAYYQIDHENDIHLLSGGKDIFDPTTSRADANFLRKVCDLESPLLVNIDGPGQREYKSQLKKRGLSSAMFVQIKRLKTRNLLFAGRDQNDQPFRDGDMEMFSILSNQAAIAIENARLYEDLRDYVRQVEDSQQALVQAEKMATVGRLTASIAHEINNPLQAVRNCLHLAQRDDLPEEERKEYSDLAKTELNRLMTTVQRMLDFYRPGAVTPTKVNLPEILQYVIDLMSKQLEKRGIAVNVQATSTLPAISAVSSQIQQIFINLILNAFDAMPEGGQIDIRMRSVKGGVEVIFKDSGPGIPDERVSHIFEPFYSTKNDGTGLGLTVSYNIISAHGGSFEHLQESESGACFRIYLPIGGKK